jgi:glycosyltransferase involved in cell wall biosynthesis
MKAAILTRDYPPVIGGIATHVDGLVKGLRKKNIDVDLFVGSNDAKTLLLPFDMPLNRYDVVHVQSLPYGAFVYGVPLVVTVHSPVLEEFTHYRRGLKIESIPAIALERISLSRTSAVLAVSDRTRTDLCRMYDVKPEKVDVIGNGVDYERFAGNGDTNGASTMKNILVVSRLEPRKNVRLAIEAVAELKGMCQLEIAGDGSERAALEVVARSLGVGGSVNFLGRIAEAALPRVYRESSIFLTTSNSEGFGLSLLEAMSSGRACVASDLPTHRALIEHNVSGLIYDTKQELVACLKTLLSSPDTVKRLGHAAQEVARQHTWDRVADRVIEAYRRVAP